MFESHPAVLRSGLTLSSVLVDSMRYWDSHRGSHRGGKCLDNLLNPIFSIDLISSEVQGGEVIRQALSLRTNAFVKRV